MSKDNDHIRMVGNSGKFAHALPPYVNQIRDNSISILINCLDELFSGCDDLFFDLSSRAASNSEQNLYFESMRELRVKKHGVINRYKQNIERSFASLTTNDQPLSRQDDPTKLSYDNLSIVKNDDLEQEVAISGMISKARNHNQEALYQLTTRLDYLLKSITVTDNNNPLDPQQLCSEFADACELLEISIKAKIIIFKQFDRHIISRFANIYASANNLLVNAGVMPKITHSIKKEPAKVSKQDGSQGHNIAEEITPTGQAFDFFELSNILASVRLTQGINQLPNFFHYTTNPGPAISAQELVNLLSQIQFAERPFSDTEQQDKNRKNLHDVINQLLARNNPSEPNALKQPDEDVINLVSMFFDFVLDDPSLPVATQALISRLQIPILKVAIRNKGFFSSGNHPARQLVNLIASSSIGCDDHDSKDKLHKKVSDIVHYINENYVDDETVFESQLQVLTEFVDREQRNANLVEKRTSQAIEGQARTSLAKGRSQALLYEKLEKRQLPSEIMSFLTNQWLQVLIMIHLKDGEESPQWLEALQLVEDISWSCQPHQDSRSIDRLTKLIPELIDKVTNGLHKTIDDPKQLEQQISTLKRALSAPKSDPKALRPLNAEEASTLGHTPGGGSRSWQEMTAVERQQAKYKTLTYDFIKKAEELPLGTWLIYEETSSGKKTRCKLASKIKESDSYVFVNRYGFKVIEKHRKDFAYDMQKSLATPLTNGLLVDRAMSSVIAKLQQLTDI